MEFATDVMFAYGFRKKRIFAAKIFGVLSMLVAITLIYLFYLKESSNFIILGINQFFSHVGYHIANSTVLSMFYSSLFGGLFFVTIPTEAVFIHYLAAGYSFFLVIPIFIGCFFIAYNINYFIGMHLAEISKKIITTKKFYKVKTIINKYGDWAILGINAVPFLPAQPLSAILGVFRYNRKRFYFYFLLGQTIKHFALAIGYIYLFR